MSYHWSIIDSDGKTHEGTDCFPKDELKNKTRTFILSFPDKKDFTHEVPEGCRLVFIQRNRIDFVFGGNYKNQMFFYIIGHKGKEKKLHKVEVTNEDTLHSVEIQSDGRPD